MSKPRNGARVDVVQPAAIAALRSVGAEVLVLDVSEEGQPDLLVGFIGTLTLIEMKSAGGRVSEAQKENHDRWARKGIRVHVCLTPREALDAIGLDERSIAERLQAMRELVPVAKRARAAMRPAVKSWRPT